MGGVEFSKEVFDEVCIYLAMGESLRTACSHEGMPSKASVLRWLHQHPELRDQYTRAKQEGADAIAEDAFDISDELPPMKDDGSIDNGFVNYAKHRTDIRKWYLSKIAPKKYGEKSSLELSGPDGGAILTRDVSDMSDEQLAALITK